MTVYERIRQRRKELGLSAEDLARALGVSRATVYRYESAETEKLPSSVLEPLADVLLTTPADLMGWESEAVGRDPFFAAAFDRLCMAWNKTPEQVERDTGLSHERMLALRRSKEQPTPEEVSMLASYFSVPARLLEPRTQTDAAEPKNPGFRNEKSNVLPFVPPIEYGGTIPVLGKVPAGIPIEAVEDVIERIPLPASFARSGEDYFGLLVTGDSMAPEYLDGDIVIIRAQPTADTGDDVVAYIGGADATLKRIVVTTTGVQLRPLNPAYETRRFTNAQIESLPLVIAGIVVEQRRRRRK